ncbi:MAG: thiamine pyrophosphate-binding protein [Gammaproteobacteria bacterium]|nr:thiamine pyrophosphate-binding protein [Gammaproteobacteria bacterium]
MKTRTGGELLIDCLRAQQTSIVFGVPGESYLAVLDALYSAKDDIKTVMCRQEGGAGFMAASYGKLTGRPGICFVTRGPGATNASIGVHTAQQDSSPMILFVGQVARGDRGRDAFQEIDYTKFFADSAKWVVEINDANRIPEIVARAFSVALSGRPGPVVVSLPEDMLTGATSATPTPLVQVNEPEIRIQTLDEVFDLLTDANKPIVMVGGGGWTSEGRKNLKQFAKQNDLPVVVGFRCQDRMDNQSECFAGDAGVGVTEQTKALFRDADLILAVGLDLSEITTNGYQLLDAPVPQQKLIHVHASADEIGKVYQPTLGVQCGINTFVHAVAEHAPAKKKPWKNWTSDARKGYLQSLQCPKQPGSVDMGEIMAWLRDHLPDDVIITNGAGNFSVWPNKFFQYGEHARLIAPESGAMGYGVPAAIATKLTHPNRTVVCFAGDGDFQMNGQELATAAQHNAQPIILLLNNSMYGTIRMHQERNYPNRVHGTGIVNPDFGLLAQAYGFHFERVTQTGHFESAFRNALTSNSGALIELEINAEAITPRQTLSEVRKSGKQN